MADNSLVEAAVDRYFAAITARDAAAWAANFVPDGSSEDPVGGPPVVGTEALAAFQQGIFDAFPVMRLTPVERFYGGAQAAVKWTCHVGTGSNAADFEGINFYEVSGDGRIVRQKAFWDMAAVQRRLRGE
jgi:ketosteroid isomerase-like protein